MTAKQPIMLGRKDYLIRSLDPGTGAEHWNVTYSEIVHLDLEQPSSDDASSSTDIASLDDHDGNVTARLPFPVKNHNTSMFTSLRESGPELYLCLPVDVQDAIGAQEEIAASDVHCGQVTDLPQAVLPCVLDVQAPPYFALFLMLVRHTQLSLLRQPLRLKRVSLD